MHTKTAGRSHGLSCGSAIAFERNGRFRESDLPRRLFESILSRCIDEGWSAGKALRSMPAWSSPMQAARMGIAGEKGLPPQAAGRAVDGYLAGLDDAALEPRPRSYPSAPFRPIRHHAGPAPMVDKRSLPIARTTWEAALPFSSLEPTNAVGLGFRLSTSIERLLNS